MRIIAFITHSADIRQLLDHIGAESEPPLISLARGLQLWDDCDAPVVAPPLTPATPAPAAPASPTSAGYQ